MPRHNKSPKHTYFTLPTGDDSRKKRYASKQAAERAIKELQKYDLDLQLYTYQSPTDGGWYLTSTSQT